MNSQELLDSVRNEQNPMSILIGALNLLKKENGFEQDLLTPGFIKEWMVSEILGHECHKTKHGADAYSKDGLEKYEYLTCKEGGSFQLDRIHEENLHRITRNNSIFFALFEKENGLDCNKIIDDVIYIEQEVELFDQLFGTIDWTIEKAGSDE